MIKIFLALLLFTISAFSSNIFINDSKSSFDNFEINIYQDKTRKLTLQEIQKIKKFQKTSNSIALGEVDGTLWYHFNVQNITKKMQKRVFFVTNPNLYEFDLFIVDNKKVIATQSVGQNILSKDGVVAGYNPELEISLDSGKKLDIYFRVNSQFHHTYKVVLNTPKDLVAYKVVKTSLLSFYFGAVSSILLYNLFIYLTTRDNNYLLYAGFIFFYILSQAQLNTSLNTIFTSIQTAFIVSTAHIFWTAFHTLFSVKILNIEEYYPRLGKSLLYIGFFLLAIGIFGLYNLECAVGVLMILWLVLPFILLFIAIKLHQKKNRLAIFYIIAQTLFLISSFIFGLLVSGALEYTTFTRYIHLVGSFFEIILFSFALAYRTRLIMQENQKQKKLVDEYSKLSFLGQTVINIYHQWKSPVNNIYNSINYIETAKEFKDKELDNIIDENLKEIKENILYLRDTSSSYLDYYKGIDQQKIYFNLKEELDLILKLHIQEFRKLSIDVNLQCNGNIELYLQKNILTNIVIILIENSINVFKYRNIKNPKLDITVIKKNGYIIKVSDNAGGIKLKNINEIFEKNHSSSDSTGLGLFLAKHFLMPKLGGEISVANENNGATFSVNLPF